MASLTRSIRLAPEPRYTQSDCCVVDDLVVIAPRDLKTVNMKIQKTVKTSLRKD